MSEFDDILAVHRPSPNVVCHRPAEQDSLTPACGAASTEPFQRFAAGYAHDRNATLCRNPACYPKGWAT